MRIIKRRLRLVAETVRTLSTDQMSKVGGGGTSVVASGVTVIPGCDITTMSNRCF